MRHVRADAKAVRAGVMGMREGTRGARTGVRGATAVYITRFLCPTTLGYKKLKQLSIT